MEESNIDWVAIYGAALSTLITVIAGICWIHKQYKKHLEKNKFSTMLYLLRKIDKDTKKVHPVIVLMIANLGTEKIAFKSLEYDGIAENECRVHGNVGWYEEPEAAYGIRNRLLPTIIESSDVKDLPILSLGIFSNTRNLRIWLTDFDDKKYFLEEQTIKEAILDVNKYLEENK